MSHTIHQAMHHVMHHLIQHPDSLAGKEYAATRIWLRHAFQQTRHAHMFTAAQTTPNQYTNDTMIPNLVANAWATPLYTDHPIPSAIQSPMQDIQAGLLAHTQGLMPSNKAYAGIGSRATPPNTLKTMEEIGHKIAAQGWSLRSGGAEKADDAFERGVFGLTGKIDRERAQLFLGWNNIEIKRGDDIPSRVKHTGDGYIVTQLPPPLVEFFKAGHSMGWHKATDGKHPDQGTLITALHSMDTNPTHQAWRRQGIITPQAVGMLHLVERYHGRPGALGRGGLSLMARNGQQVYGEHLNKAVDCVVAYTEMGSGKGGTGQALRMARDAGIPCLDLGHPTLAQHSSDEIVAMMQSAERTATRNTPTHATPQAASPRKTRSAADLF